MFYVYIIKSQSDGKIYIGSTKDLRRRILEHEKGKVRSTRYRGKFDLAYYEAYKFEKDART